MRKRRRRSRRRKRRRKRGETINIKGNDWIIILEEENRK